MGFQRIGVPKGMDPRECMKVSLSWYLILSSCFGTDTDPDCISITRIYRR